MDKSRVISLPKVLDQRGNLFFVESQNHISFAIKKVYWIYDVLGGEIRRGHTSWENMELIVALSGSFDVILHDGLKKIRYYLNRSHCGLYVPKMFWRCMRNFSTNSLTLISSYIPYNNQDYIRNFEYFKNK